MALTFFWRCEGTTLDATDDYYGASDNTATAAGTPAINATAALIGSNGLQVDGASDHYQFNNQTNPTVFSSAGSVGFWIRWQAYTTGATHFYVRATTSDTQSLRLSTLGTNRLRFQIRNDASSHSLDMATMTIANATTYFCTASWDIAADLSRVRMYDSGGTLIEEATSTDDLAAAQPAALDSTSGVRFGEMDGVASTCYIDNIFIGSAYADADTFLTNRSITSYTGYSTGGTPQHDPFVKILFRAA